jgi:hypothetical protein
MAPMCKATRASTATALATALAAGLLSWVIAAPGGAQEEPRAGEAAPRLQCREQQPDPVLIRSNWVVKARMPREEQQRRRELHQQAIRIRTERYGYFEGFGRPEWNPHPPSYYARRTTLWGLTVRVHERIIPALQCAAQAIADQCAATPYQPQRLSGIRDRNTYHNGEVSNHVYGIALDIDPQRNTCCGCVAPWNEHPLCRQPVSSIFDRMAMPECWVRQFQRFGFYWLGDDELQDTMHFEFLADPERILAP